MDILSGLFKSTNNSEIRYETSIANKVKFEHHISQINENMSHELLKGIIDSASNYKSEILNDINIYMCNDVDLRLENMQDSHVIDLVKFDSNLATKLIKTCSTQLIEMLKNTLLNESVDKLLQAGKVDNEAGLISQLASLLPNSNSTSKTIKQEMDKNTDLCNSIENYIDTVLRLVEKSSLANKMVSNFKKSITLNIRNIVRVSKCDRSSILIKNEQNIKTIHQNIIKMNIVAQIFQEISTHSIFTLSTEFKSYLESLSKQSFDNKNHDEKVTGLLYPILIVGGFVGLFLIKGSVLNTASYSETIDINSLFHDNDFVENVNERRKDLAKNPNNLNLNIPVHEYLRYLRDNGIEISNPISLTNDLKLFFMNRLTNMKKTVNFNSQVLIKEYEKNSIVIDENCACVKFKTFDTASGNFGKTLCSSMFWE